MERNDMFRKVRMVAAVLMIIAYAGCTGIEANDAGGSKESAEGKFSSDVKGTPAVVMEEYNEENPLFHGATNTNKTINSKDLDLSHVECCWDTVTMQTLKSSTTTVLQIQNG